MDTKSMVSSIPDVHYDPWFLIITKPAQKPKLMHQAPTTSLSHDSRQRRARDSSDVHQPKEKDAGCAWKAYIYMYMRITTTIPSTRAPIALTTLILTKPDIWSSSIITIHHWEVIKWMIYMRISELGLGKHHRINRRFRLFVYLGLLNQPVTVINSLHLSITACTGMSKHCKLAEGGGSVGEDNEELSKGGSIQISSGSWNRFRQLWHYAQTITNRITANGEAQCIHTYEMYDIERDVCDEKRKKTKEHKKGRKQRCSTCCCSLRTCHHRLCSIGVCFRLG